MSKKFRKIPDVIVNVLRDCIPGVVSGEIGGKRGKEDVYLLMMPAGERMHALHYLAGPGFADACKLAETEPDKLVGRELELLDIPGPQESDGVDFKSRLPDDHLLVTHEASATFVDGTKKRFDIDVTVDMVRQYFADPNRCECDNCQRIFPAAMEMLLAQEAHLAGEISARQMTRKLKQMGYVRGEQIQYS
jgi:hypothetical protein